MTIWHEGDGTIAYRFIGPIAEDSYREVIWPRLKKPLALIVCNPTSRDALPSVWIVPKCFT